MRPVRWRWTNAGETNQRAGGEQSSQQTPAASPLWLANTCGVGKFSREETMRPLVRITGWPIAHGYLRALSMVQPEGRERLGDRLARHIRTPNLSVRQLDSETACQNHNAANAASFWLEQDRFNLNQIMRRDYLWRANSDPSDVST